MNNENQPESVRGIHLAAGGLVWRRTRFGDVIGIVHRKKYNDWTLPKGKPEENETLDHAAKRETEEETGFLASPRRLAGSYSYMNGATPKVVLIWEMEGFEEPYQEDANQAAARKNEIDDHAWLPPEEAVRRLDHESERDFVARHCRKEQFDEWNACCIPSRRVSQPKLDRLAAARQTVGEGLEGVMTQPGPGQRSNSWWAACARRSLEKASLALNQRDLDRGWGAIHDAERFIVFGLSDDDLLSRAATLAAESPTKLKSWRAEAVAALFQRADLQELLKPNAPPLNGKRPALESAVVEALSVLHEGSNNVYHRVHLVGEQLRNMVIWCGLILIAVLGASLVPDPTSAFYFTKIFPVLLAGALGGVVSTMIQLSRVGESKIPEALLQGLITSGRPLVGAASALFIYVVLLSNVVTLISKPPDKDEALAAGLVLGFAAGFAEKLVLSTVARLAGGGDAKDEKVRAKK